MVTIVRKRHGMRKSYHNTNLSFIPSHVKSNFERESQTLTFPPPASETWLQYFLLSFLVLFSPIYVFSSFSLVFFSNQHTHNQASKQLESKQASIHRLHPSFNLTWHPFLSPLLTLDTTTGQTNSSTSLITPTRITAITTIPYLTGWVDVFELH